LGISPEANPEALADGRVELLEGAVDTPEAKVVVDGLAGREVVGQKAPGAAATHDVDLVRGGLSVVRRRYLGREDGALNEPTGHRTNRLDMVFS
jgi:hypothetical protein